MKKLKKVFAVLLTLAMVLGMSMTSFAADYSIKVTKLVAGTTVHYVQIVKQDADKSTGSNWELTDKAKSANIGMTVAQLEELGETDNAGQGTINSDLTDLNFSGLTSFDGTATADAKGDALISVTEPGLYAIKADTTENVVYSWMLAYVGVNDNNNQATVTAKGKTNQITKEGPTGKTSVAANETVEYTVTINYPYFAENLTNKSFVITDTVTNGTFTNKAPVISEKGVGLAAEDGYANSTTMTIKLDMSQYEPANAGQQITITYEVKANSDVSASKLLTNEVNSIINGDPETETKSKVVLPSFDVNITKSDTEGNPIPDEAKFQLYEADANSNVTISVNGVADPVHVKAVGEEKTTVNGVASFTGLASSTDKTYYVKETQAPNGYALQEKAYPLTGGTVEIDGPKLVEGVMLTTYKNKVEYSSVGFGKNDAGDIVFHDDTLSALPSTGGIGTTIFTIGGCAIMVIAAALFFASRRKSAK